MVRMTAIPFERWVEYPESDGQPMGETDVHRREILDLIAALEDRFREAADVYVAGDLFIYYVDGDPRSVVCPDVFVVKGVPKGNRRVYKLWEEGRAPSFVIEVSSQKTSGEDTGRKKAIFERLGVEEYFLHDPLGEYLIPRLQGFRLVAGWYRPIEPAADGSLASATTGLTLRLEGERLRLVDTASGEPLLHIEEVQARLREAEAELARLRRQLKGGHAQDA